jgi:hypothetical protein
MLGLPATAGRSRPTPRRGMRAAAKVVRLAICSVGAEASALDAPDHTYAGRQCAIQAVRQPFRRMNDVLRTLTTADCPAARPHGSWINFHRRRSRPASRAIESRNRQSVSRVRRKLLKAEVRWWPRAELFRASWKSASIGYLLLDLDHSSSCQRTDRRGDQPPPMVMSSQPIGVVWARSPGRSSTVVVGDSTIAGPSIACPEASASSSNTGTDCQSPR